MAQQRTSRQELAVPAPTTEVKPTQRVLKAITGLAARLLELTGPISELLATHRRFADLEAPRP